MHIFLHIFLHIFCIFCAYSMHILTYYLHISFAYFLHIFLHIYCILVIFLAYLFAYLCAYFMLILCIFCAYFMHILCIFNIFHAYFLADFWRTACTFRACLCHICHICCTYIHISYIFDANLGLIGLLFKLPFKIIVVTVSYSDFWGPCHCPSVDIPPPASITCSMP